MGTKPLPNTNRLNYMHTQAQTDTDSHTPTKQAQHTHSRWYADRHLAQHLQKWPLMRGALRHLEWESTPSLEPSQGMQGTSGLFQSPVELCSIFALTPMAFGSSRRLRLRQLSANPNILPNTINKCSVGAITDLSVWTSQEQTSLLWLCV